LFGRKRDTKLTRFRRKSVLIRHAKRLSVGRVRDANKPLLIVYAAAALAVALIGARYLKSVSVESAQGGVARQGTFATGASYSTGGQATKFQSLIVHVAGAVRRPGLVRVRDGDRVGDAIEAAGGPRSTADINAVNLAARLADGQQVIVPTRAGPGAAAGASAAAGPISLSSATAEQLDGLDGIGPGLAAKIVAYRTEHGGFKSVDELGEVPGIGDKRMDSLRAQLQP
jgi:competence protein ComEA